MKKSIVLVAITFIIAFFAINTSFAQKVNHKKEFNEYMGYDGWVKISNGSKSMRYEENKQTFYIFDFSQDETHVTYTIKLNTVAAIEIESLFFMNGGIFVHSRKKVYKNDEFGEPILECDMLVISGKTYRSK